MSRKLWNIWIVPTKAKILVSIKNLKYKFGFKNAGIYVSDKYHKLTINFETNCIFVINKCNI